MQTFRDVIRCRHILSALTAKELKAQYRTMTLGFAWALLNPLVMVTVLSTVFIVVFGQGLEKPSQVIVALIPYNFFTYCLSGSAVAITGNSALVKKVSFPRQILPLSVVLNFLVHFAIQSSLIVGILLLFPTAGEVIGWQLLWLPVVLAVLIALAIGTGLMVSALAVVFRDTRYAVQSGITILFWASPVIYDAAKLEGGDNPPWLSTAYFLNPLAGILDSFRAVLFHGRAPDPVHFGMATAITLVIGILGVRTFWRHEPQFADLIR